MFFKTLACFCFLALSVTFTRAQESAEESKPVVFTTQQDHQNMLDQLGITKLRPGRNGDADAPNGANYDEAKANPYPALPEVLDSTAGKKITTPEQWNEVRRPELVRLLETHLYGRIPENVPDVKWEVVETREVEAGGKPAIQKHIVGTVDNSACPEIVVNISMSLTLPKDAKGSVPVLMTFGWTPFEPNPFARFARRGDNDGPRPPSKRDLLIAAGWGCAMINPSTIQDDAGGWRPPRSFGAAQPENVEPTGAGLTRGIIGLSNLGQPRKPDQWGSLRAWGWGASRALDYFEQVPEVDATRVGIAGVSRYGKAALVTMAFDERFAMGLIASSGAGGTALHRRNFGESLENLAGSGEYHWMCGNYLQYAAEESSFGSKTAADLPVDSHMMLALCAPRLAFISHGIPERGDAHWLDHQGSFMAAVAAQPVYRLLGAKDLGRSDDYLNERMPAMNVDMLDGALAWRQHDGGHTDGPNVGHFIHWAELQWTGKPHAGAGDATKRSLKEAVGARVKLGVKPTISSHDPWRRDDANSREAHRQLLAKTKQGKVDVYFQGDSITRRWGATDYPKLLAHWKKSFHGWNAANFAWGGDNTHHMLWRMQNGELDGVSPKVICLQAGANNLPWRGPANQSHVNDVVEGIQAIIDEFRSRFSEVPVVLTAMFPRDQNPELANVINGINQELETISQADERISLDQHQ